MLKEKHEIQLYGIKKGVAQRRNIAPENVYIKEHGTIL